MKKFAFFSDVVFTFFVSAIFTLCLFRYLGVKLPKITIPVSPGRNLAIIIEVAARNHRLKSMGYDAAEELIHRSMGR